MIEKTKELTSQELEKIIHWRCDVCGDFFGNSKEEVIQHIKTLHSGRGGGDPVFNKQGQEMLQQIRRSSKSPLDYGYIYFRVEPGIDKPIDGYDGSGKALPVSLSLKCPYPEFIEWVRNYPGEKRLELKDHEYGVVIKFMTTDSFALGAGLGHRTETAYTAFELAVTPGNPVKLDGLYLYDSGKTNNPNTLNDYYEFVSLAKRYEIIFGEAEELQDRAAKPELPNWKKIIPNKWRDWEILELWQNNYTSTEIGGRLGIPPTTVTNRISTLRLRHPKAGIFTDVERRKLLRNL